MSAETERKMAHVTDNMTSPATQMKIEKVNTVRFLKVTRESNKQHNPPNNSLLLLMASLPLLFSFLFLCLLSIPCDGDESPDCFVIPVRKDVSSLQYLTTLTYGTPPVATKVVLDLGGSFIWLHCASRNTPSSSTLTTPHRSIQCLTAKTHKADDSSSFLSTPLDEEDQHQPCQISPENSITGTVAAEGDLVQDLMALQSTKLETIQVHFTCSPTRLLNGLAKGAGGMLGLGRSRTSLPSQLFDAFTTHRKITLCLSSSQGLLLLGNIPYGSRILNSLTFTPLLVTDVSSHQYFINVNAVKINGKRLSLGTSPQFSEGVTTLLSTIVPYTIMQSSIYANFKTAFVDAAVRMNMIRLGSVAPFEVCFRSGGVVPVIELVLQSEMVKWNIDGRNSMVRVNHEVVCLGFLDGGVNPRYSMVIGGYQLEDVIVQFDLATSMLGFSSSLSTMNTTCSHFRFGSMSAHSV